MTTRRSIPPAIAIGGVTALFLSDFVLFGIGGAPPMTIWMAQPVSVILLAWFVAPSVDPVPRCLLWVTMAIGIVQAVVIQRDLVAGIASQDPMLLALVYLGCGALGAVLAAVALMVSTGHDILSEQSRALG